MHKRIGRAALTLLISLLVCGAACATDATAAPPTLAAGPAPRSVALPPAADSEGDDGGSEDADLLLCALELDKTPLTNGAGEETLIETHVRDHGMLLPLGVISAVLELPVTTDLSKGAASGTLGTPERTFTLDMTTQQVTVAGKPARYDATLIELRDTDIFVDSALLGEWFGMEISVDRYAATVNIHPYEPLPIQLQWAREQRGGGSNYRVGGLTFVPPTVGNSYQPWELPSVDYTLSSSRNSGLGAANQAPFQYTLFATGDIGYFGGRVYVSSDSRGRPTNTQMLLGREDCRGELLGPLHATSFSFGDVTGTSTPMINDSAAGRGFTLSNRPFSSPETFDVHTFQGLLPQGWDVELYRNGTLIDYRPPSPDLQYAFHDVPLFYGLNSFRLVFYGPHGEMRTEDHTYNIGPNTLAPGATRYDMSYTDSDNRPLAAMSVAQRQSSAQCDLGLSHALTASGTLAAVYFNGAEHNYAGLGLTGYLSSYLVNANVTHDDASQRWATDMKVQTRLASAGVSVDYAQLDGFTSPLYTNYDSGNLRSLLQCHVDGLHVTSDPHFGALSGVMTVEGRPEGQGEGFGVSQSAQGQRMQLTQNLAWASDAQTAQWGVGESTLAGATAGWNGETEVNLPISGGGTARGDLVYGLGSGWRLQAVDATADLMMPHNSTLSLSQTYLCEESDYSLTATYTHPLKACALGLSAGYTTPRNFSMGVTVSGNVTPEPRNDKWKATAQPHAEDGKISALVFLDTNRNGRWDEGEPLLSNVGFSVNGQDVPQLTDPKGVALLESVPVDQSVTIAIQPSTLENPLWVTARPNECCIPRTGHTLQIDFPVLVTGEISGIVSAQATGAPLAGLMVEVLDAQGVVAQRVRTAYDGFYSFSTLLPGTYTVCIPDAEAARVHLMSVFRSVTIPPQGDYLDNVNLMLPPASAPPT